MREVSHLAVEAAGSGVAGRRVGGGCEDVRMRLRTTSTQRTYRYVRLSIIGATALLGVSVALQMATGGVLPSLSAAYYTPAGPLFVGSLCAVALALFVLSGRSVEQGLLDVAAVLALAVAVVPTTVEGAVCPGGGRCVPVAVVPTVTNNGVAVASVVLAGVVGAIILAAVQGTLSRGVFVTAAAVAAVPVGFGAWAVLDSAGFFAAAHNVAAIAFFVLVAAVASLAAWRPQRAGPRVRAACATVAIGILVSLAGVLVALAAGLPGDVPWVLVGEAAALALFAVFWVVQTAELWNDPDPSFRG